MIQVKIIRQKAALLERDINDFLAGLARTPNTKTDLKDIKLYHIASEDIDTAMIIYNQWAAQPQQQKRR